METLEELKNEIETLKNKLAETQQQLEKYTNNDRHKRYYEKNKEKIKQNGLKYLQNLKENNPEKIKEYSKTAYKNKKEKLKECENI
jgi:gas vesicle protein